MPNPEPISNDLINIQVEAQLFDDMIALVDRYRDKSITIVQVLGVLALVHEEMLHENVDET